MKSEQSQFVEELERLARLTAFRPGLRLVVGESGTDWSFNWRTGTISVDGGRLAAESADFNRGLVMHESAHAAMTRLQSIVPAATLQDRRQFALLNAVEDCRIETWMQRRFPGCRPWVREYNDRLFRPALDPAAARPPAAQFLTGILTRWWYGRAAEPMCDAARQALESAWPAIERAIEVLPPAPDSVIGLPSAYLRSPVSRCYTVDDSLDPPDPFEQAVRIAQYDMWSIVHQDILPVYLRLLPAGDDASGSLMASLVLLASPNRISRTGRPRGVDSLKPDGHDVYQASCRRQHSAIDRLGDDFLRWFEAHGKAKLRRGFPWGHRLDLRAAMRFEADPAAYRSLWSRIIVPTRIDPHFSLVIDRSGSMAGEKIEQSFHGVVLLCEVCRRVGVPLNIYAFSSEVERLLHFDEPLSSDVCARLGTMPGSADGGTDLGGALEQVAADLGESPFRDRFVLILSDGEPDDPGSVRSQIERLAAGGIGLIGLGLGPRTAALESIIPNSQVNLAAADVPSAFASLLLRAYSPLLQRRP